MPILKFVKYSQGSIIDLKKKSAIKDLLHPLSWEDKRNWTEKGLQIKNATNAADLSSERRRMMIKIFIVLIFQCYFGWRCKLKRTFISSSLTSVIATTRQLSHPWIMDSEWNIEELVMENGTGYLRGKWRSLPRKFLASNMRKPTYYVQARVCINNKGHAVY